MTTLSISLGKAPNGTSLHASNLLAAKPTNLADNSLTALQISVDGSELGTTMNPMDLSAYMPALKKDASVSFHVIGQADLQPIHTAFLLAGLKGASETKQADGSRVLTAVKQTGSIPSVKLQLDDTIDEDGLLADSSNLLSPPPAMSAAATKNADDCGGRQPCDNCTCGRADSSQQPKEIKSSSCGKCHLGDAFRCASCPYLGKPAFKPGEEHLVLDLQDDL